jgi:hypothetical protein
MEWTGLLKNLVKVVFYIALPAAVIVLRVQKKITTGFGVGLVLTSIILGVIGAASIQKDPVDEFMESINSRNMEEARKDYRILVQYGEEKLSQINTEKIVYIDDYRAMKGEVYREYLEIVNRYLKEYKIEGLSSCSGLSQLEDNLSKLEHAELILGYAELVGEEKPGLRNELEGRLNHGEDRLKELKKRCL